MRGRFSYQENWQRIIIILIIVTFWKFSYYINRYNQKRLVWWKKWRTVRWCCIRRLTAQRNWTAGEWDGVAQCEPNVYFVWQRELKAWQNSFQRRPLSLWPKDLNISRPAKTINHPKIKGVNTFISKAIWKPIIYYGISTSVKKLTGKGLRPNFSWARNPWGDIKWTVSTRLGGRHRHRSPRLGCVRKRCSLRTCPLRTVR